MVESNIAGWIIAVILAWIFFKNWVYFKLNPSIKKLHNLLKIFNPKKEYKKEEDFQNNLFKYLKPYLKKDIQKPKGDKRPGKRDPDLLFKKIYPIEAKINFSYRASKELRTQIPDYVVRKKHINMSNLSFRDKILLKIFDAYLFVVISNIKNKKAWQDFKRYHKEDYANRAYYYLPK